jgi:hypothetical protein
MTSRVIDSPIPASQNRLSQKTQPRQEREIPMQEIVERYIASRNGTDPERRRKLTDELWADQASYIDPLAEAHGRDVIAAAQPQFPGFVFTLAGPVDAHHHQARFTWGLRPAQAEPVVIGFDVAVATEDAGWGPSSASPTRFRPDSDASRRARVIIPARPETGWRK